MAIFAWSDKINRSMNKWGINRSNHTAALTVWMLIAVLVTTSGCKSSGRSDGGFDILGPADETAEAAQIIIEANEELTKIKVLYKNNEGKREELKKAMEANEAEKVKKIADDVVYLINDGAASGKSAVEKIAKAQEMQVNDD